MDEPVVEKVAALPGVVSAVRTDEGLLVRLDADGTPQRLVAELVRLDVPVRSVGPHRRLEDAFLTLIGARSMSSSPSRPSRSPTATARAAPCPSGSSWSGS